MVEYFGSYEVAPGQGGDPGSAPDVCVLCQQEAPAWWYVVEPDVDASGRGVGPTALARWWAIGPHCHLLISKDPNALPARLQAAITEVAEQEVMRQVLPKFLRCAKPLRVIAP